MPGCPFRSLSVALVLVSPELLAQAARQDSVTTHELSITMRDGVKLYAVALVPKARTQPLPIMLVRTPYGVSGMLGATTLGPRFEDLARDGYIFVWQDIRGRYKSEGQFVMNRPQHDPADRNGIDEATDTYDTVDWLVKNLDNNNGRVGVMGASYMGWLAGVAGLAGHPAIKAISPQAPMTDTWLGDDFFHQGAFRQDYGLLYVSWMESTNDQHTGVRTDRYDDYDYHLQFPTLTDLRTKAGVAGLPSWIAFVNHPAYDAFWQAKAMQRVVTTPSVPVLSVGGFWDQEDMFGPQEAYRVLERNDAGARQSRFRRTPSSSSRWTCTNSSTPSDVGTASWCRCRAPGFRSTIGTRKRSWRTFSTPSRQTSARGCSACGTPPGGRRT